MTAKQAATLAPRPLTSIGMSFIRSATQSLRTVQAGLGHATPSLRQTLLSQPALFHTTASRWALSADARKKIDAAVQGHPLVVFMKGTPELPMCGFSRGAVCNVLQDIYKVPSDKLKTYNVLDDQELREGIKDYSSWPTIPQIYLKGDFLGGFDILLSMHQSGELEELLVGSGVIPHPDAAEGGAKQ